ncbi:MAG: hypothetical protein QOH12_363 [Solirubrobacteraceae bacterium]|jgi:hypothetical protein|nr:hypothetical protein [Solirubrobacteraceae bacterium]
MGKTPKKNKNKKKKNSDLAHRLRRLGLRKELAKRIAENAETARGQIPKSARKTIKEMRAKVDDLGAGVFRPTQGEDPDGKAPEADAEAAEQKKNEKQKKKKKNKKQEKASAKKLAKKAKRLKKKAMKKAKRVRKAARAKAREDRKIDA